MIWKRNQPRRRRQDFNTFESLETVSLIEGVDLVCFYYLDELSRVNSHSFYNRFHIPSQASNTSSMHLIATTIAGVLAQAITVLGQCFSDPATNTEWAQLINGDDTSTEFSVEGSCCQSAVCNIPCPEAVPYPPIVSEDKHGLVRWSCYFQKMHNLHPLLFVPNFLYRASVLP